MIFGNYKKQQGMAIFSALFVVTIVSIIAISVLISQRLEIHRTQQFVTANQNYQYAQGVLYWAVGALKEYDQAVPDFDDDEDWSIELEETSIADNRGYVSGRIETFSNKLNINSLVGKDAIEFFIEYLQEKNVDLDEDQLKAIAQRIVAWKKQDNTDSDVEDQRYLANTPAYRTAQQDMIQISELRLVEGVEADIYKKIEPHLTVLPHDNLAFASLAVDMQFFLLRSNVVLDDQELTVISLLQRGYENNAYKVNVVWQSYGE